MSALLICLLSVVFDLSSGQTQSDVKELNVFIIPHSHTDAGWIRTFDDYYMLQVKTILTSITTALEQNENRTFTWADMAYFSRWWDDQNETIKEQVKAQVQRGQLEFVGGGWVMHDEAVSDYTADIVQMTLGHQFIAKEFGEKYVPKYGWQIDPFGGSFAANTLFSLMGFDGVVHTRIDEDLKKALFDPRGAGMQFVWRANPEYGYTADMLTHVLSHHYGIIWNDWSAREDCIPGKVPSTVTLDRSAELFMEWMAHHAQHYKTNNLLYPFGGDFTFCNAEVQFDWMEQVIDFIQNQIEFYGTCNNCTKDTSGPCALDDGVCAGSDSGSSTYMIHCNYGDVCAGDRLTKYKFNVKFSHVGEYFAALKKSNHSFPLYRDDLMPYHDEFPEQTSRDGEARWWTGFYSDHGTLKQQIRHHAAMLRVAETLYSSAAMLEDARNDNSTVQRALAKAYPTLVEMRHVDGILQHHDAVTSTSKAFVVADYLSMSSHGMTLGRKLVNETAPLLLQPHMDGMIPAYDRDIKHIELSDNSTVPLLVVNPLAWAGQEVVRVCVNRLDVCVCDGEGNHLLAEIFELRFPWDVNSTDTTGYELFFVAELPALGVANYWLATGSACEGKHAEHVIQTDVTDYAINMRNSKIILDLLNGAQLTLQTSDGIRIDIDRRFGTYNNLGQLDGIYVFDALAPPTLLDRYNDSMVKIFQAKGEFVQQIYLSLYPGVDETIRIYRCGTSKVECRSDFFVEVVSDIGPLSNLQTTDFVLTYQTSLPTNRSFWVDSNGFSIAKRDYQTRMTGERAGNYHPMTGRAFMRNETCVLHGGASCSVFGVVSERSLGVGSFDDGALEMMLHRTANMDDTLGAGETLVDFDRVRVRHRLMIETEHPTGKNPCDDKFHRAMLFLNNPFHLQAGATHEHAQSIHLPVYTSKQIRHSEYPPCLHLLSLQSQMAPTADNGTFLMRVLNLDTTQNQNRYNTELIFPKGRRLVNITEKSLTSVHNVTDLEDCYIWPQNGLEFDRHGVAKKVNVTRSVCPKFPVESLTDLTLHALGIRTFTLDTESTSPKSVSMVGVIVWPILGALLVMAAVCFIFIKKLKTEKFKYVKMATSPEQEMPALSVQE